MVVALALGLGGCATSSTRADLGSGPSYDVGPLTVLVLPPDKVAWECGYPTATGCYQADQHRIVTVPDPYVLIHEFKHYFEGPWHSPLANVPAAAKP